MKNLLSQLWSWLKPKLTALFTLTCKSIAKEVLDLLNDAELQQKALTAVKVAAASGLKGNAAFDLALDELKAECLQTICRTPSFRMLTAFSRTARSNNAIGR